MPQISAEEVTELRRIADEIAAIARERKEAQQAISKKPHWWSRWFA